MKFLLIHRMKKLIKNSLFLFKKFLIKFHSFFINHKKPTIIAIGDSWINLTLYFLFHDFKRYLNIRKDKFDTSDWLRSYREFNTIDCGFPGYKLCEEVKNEFFVPAVSNLTDKDDFVFLLSFGGNDLTVEFDRFIVGKGTKAKLNKKLLVKVLKNVYFDFLEDYINTIKTHLFRKGIYYKVNFFIHGYDYFRPELDKNHERFRKLFELDIPQSLIDEMIKGILDATNCEIEEFCKRIPNLNYINLRGTIKHKEWMEPLHPYASGYKKLTDKMIKEINRVRKIR